ncbi:RNA polymerase sigma factor [Coralloluteibacterium thermophilus]|uniref:RNA polymerase sigma factor n=1 Tax=Coralloluteibacterium thermophilum TaxID=2707049 RepID=A0ABV9NP16_9GAMM
MPATPASDAQERLYREAVDAHGAALARLAQAYEREPDARRDLLQDIHVGLWRSFATYDGRCSLRTWTYRVAHNVAASHIEAARRRGQAFLDLEDVVLVDGSDVEADVGAQHALGRLHALIRQLKPIDRQVIQLWLEELPAASIAEITGLSGGAVATKVHRIKALLAQRFKGERS